ncbi:MAG: hypothetical protein V4604_05850 [Bacteroidota bacterium]
MKSTVPFLTGISLLTILLTSCGDSAEENMETKADIYLAEASQSTTIDQLDLGNQDYSAFREMAEDRSLDPLRLQRIRESLKFLNEVNELCGETIGKLENYKSTLLKQVGVNASRDITEAYEARNPLSPSVYDLSKLDPNKKINNWVADGEALFALRQQFRKEAMQLFMSNSADVSGNPLNAPIPVIESFSNKNDLRQQIDRAFDPMHLRYDDVEFAKHLYSMLSDDKTTYLNYFKTTPSWITQFHLLSVCETEILAFRRNYFSFIRSMVNLSCEYDFDQMTPVVDGPNAAKAGSTVKLKVFMAALNSYNQPIVTADVNVKSITTENGYAIVTLELPKAKEVTYTGKLGLYSKSGVLRTYPWKKTITVVE